MIPHGSKVKFIYFDCMDTLIQMKGSMEVYADWTYEEVAGLRLWEDAAHFRSEWLLQREQFQSVNGTLREDTVPGRIRDILTRGLTRNRLSWSDEKLNREVARVFEKYWERYRAAAFVLPEVPRTLRNLHSEGGVPLGVVSNFMVPGGIPILLLDHTLDGFFREVLVSCDHGWRKPEESIYRAAVEAAGVMPGEILFIGDNLEADYLAPRSAGMFSILYDQHRRHLQIPHRIGSFLEIEKKLQMELK